MAKPFYAKRKRKNIRIRIGDSMSNFTVFRCAKVKANEVSYVHNHNQRTYENQSAENIDFQRTHLNQVLLGSQNTHSELKSKLDNLDSKKAIRKDANVMLEMIFSASPEYFYKGLDRDKFDKLTMKDNKSELADLFNKTLDKEKLEQFTKTVIDFCNEKFGNNIVNLTLHLDEKTPHFHLTLTPIIDGQLSAKRFFTPQTTQAWQKDFAKACEPLGLVKGMDDSQAVHQTCKDYKSNVAIEIPQPPQVEIPKPMTEKNVFEKNIFGFEKQVVDTKEILQNEKNRNLAQGQKYSFYKSFYDENKELIKKTKQAITENGVLQKENKIMKQQIDRISKDQQDRLKQVNLVAVLQTLGYEVKQESKTYCRVKTKDINLVVNVDRNTFSENNTNFNGFGAVSMLVDVFKYKFRDAIDLLKTSFSNEQIGQHISADKNASAIMNTALVHRLSYEIPEPKPNNLEKVVDYLTKDRFIKKDLVDELVKSGHLYADKNNNCVFLSGDKNFAFLRGTYKEKRFVANRGQMDFIQYSNDSSKDKIYLFESTIDLLSYRTLNPQAKGTFVSINGSAMINRVQELELDLYKKVVCCFDNDEQGQKFNEKIKKETVSQVEIDEPKGHKDWNEVLETYAKFAKKKEISFDKLIEEKVKAQEDKANGKTPKKLSFGRGSSNNQDRELTL
ncbi:MobV family relaxase [Burkholderia contaminans]|uniref:MobV family relaxase n=2 Tax=Bacteria TaxID=2 RepID=UPI002D80A83F|nr:MobV family relaxase [Burkholderia contaminans]